MNPGSSEHKTTAPNLPLRAPHPDWFIFDNKIAIHKPLYNKLGIILIVEPAYSPVLAKASSMISERGFFGEDMKIRFGTIKDIEHEIPDSHVHFFKPINLLRKLQALSFLTLPQNLVRNLDDECIIYRQPDPIFHPRIYHLVRIFQQTSTLPAVVFSIAVIINNYLDNDHLQKKVQQSTLNGIPFFPFTMRGEELLADGSPERIALRINPWISPGLNETYKGDPFKKFAISIGLGGSSVQVRYISNEYMQILNKLHKIPDDLYSACLAAIGGGGTASLLNDAYAIPMNHTGIEVFFTEPCLFEEEQLAEIKTKASMMKALGHRCFEVICHVHYIDYIMIGFNFHLKNRITLGALNQLIRIILRRKEAMIHQVNQLFSALNITINFMSPFDNLFPPCLFKKGNVAQAIIEKVLRALHIPMIVPDIYGFHEEALINFCVFALTNNKLNRQHAEVWRDIVTITRQGSPELKRALFCLPDFLILSNAVAILIATKNMLHHELSSIENFFDMHNQELASYLLKLILELEPTQQRYASLVFISIFNQVLAYNLLGFNAKLLNIENIADGNIFKFKDTEKNTTQKLLHQKMYIAPAGKLQSHAHELLHKRRYSSTFFQQALRNAACLNMETGYISLEHSASSIGLVLSQSLE